MERIIGYQYSETGAQGYYFYSGKKLLCKVSAGIFCPVLITGDETEWISDYDINSTILPGIKRTVVDNHTNKTVATITYLDRGKYHLDNGWDVECYGEVYRFFNGDQKIAEIRHCSKEEKFWIPQEEWRDFEPYFELIPEEEPDETSILLIAGFPVLRFGLL